MTATRRWAGAVFLIAALALAAPLQGARAQDGGSDAERLATEGIESLMQALEALIGMIPQYEMPEMTEEGDIIIRRKRSEPQDEPEVLPDAEDPDAPTQT